jgi:pimeloyl-ACP methyl ester carboxylesterase
MKTQFLKIPEGTLAYEETGSGPLILSVPGMGDLRAQYRYLAPRLAAAGYRVVSMDVRGHGESSINWPDYSNAGVGSDMLALLHHLDAGSAFVIGNSMAGGAAVWAAAEDPNAVRGMVLIDPSVRGEANALLRFVMRVLIARPWGPSAWISYFSTLFPSQPPPDFKAYKDALRANLRETGRIESLKRMIISSQAAAAVRLAKVKAPALVIMGSRDPDFKQPEEEARWVAQAIQSGYRMIPGAGHYPHVEMPEQTANLILSFLEEQGQR